MKKTSANLVLIGSIILVIVACESHDSGDKKMFAFGTEYTAAWNSKNPKKMASFYAENGSLIVNHGTPAVGRIQLAETARSYMEAFPDMKLTMDSLVAEADTYRYHWTFTGTNTGPGGTGNKVIFSGFERWTMNEEGLVQESIGTYDAQDYNKQLRGD